MVLDILLLPANLFIDMCEKIKEMADDEMLATLDSIKRKFIETQTAYEQGEMDEAEYNETVELLSNRLNRLQEEIEGGE